METIAVERIIMTPIDTSQLRGGFRIVAEVIPSGAENIRDEKKELFDRFGPAGTDEEVLRVGKPITIDYRITSRGRVVATGPVVYEISDIQPPEAIQVDEGTVVEIEDEPDNNQSASSPKDGRLNERERQLIRSAMQDRLLFLVEEIRQAGDLNADLLKNEAEKLENKLLKF